jgi:hypothetical protein
MEYRLQTPEVLKTSGVFVSRIYILLFSALYSPAISGRYSRTFTNLAGFKNLQGF